MFEVSQNPSARMITCDGDTQNLQITMEKEEDKKQLLPIEKYKHFKGIYIERTKEYYLCDFYEIRMSDKSVLYRVRLELNGNDQIAELRCNDGCSWRFIAVPDRLPAEIEAMLSDCIINSCLKK